jgi:hypothetical protein
MSKQLTQKLEEIATILNLATTEQQTIINNQKSHLHLQYYSFYKGYRLYNRNIDGGGLSGTFGLSSLEALKTHKEMNLFLSGILTGLKINNN